MIRVSNLTAGYGSLTVLKNVGFEIQQGEFVGVLGANGCGKTTLFKALTGLIPASGTIHVNGADGASLSTKDRARLMASVPQRFEGGLDLRCESLVGMGRYPYLSLLSGYSSEDMDIVRKAMKEMDVLQFHDRKLSELSGGEMQRVILARALAQQTPVLLLDEATSGLDHARSIEVFDRVARKHTQGLTVIAVIHDLNLAALYCDRLLMIKSGCLEYDGSVAEVFTSENLGNIYDTEIIVSKHPSYDVPQAFYHPRFHPGS